MKYWIARDKDGCLFFYKEEPFKDSSMWHISIHDTFCEPINPDLFPEVTWENSPQEVELKLCHQTETIKIADCNPKAQPCVLTNHGIDTNVVKFD